MKISIITAMPEETLSVVRAIGIAKKTLIGRLAVQQGRFADHEILIIEAGMGFKNATTMAKELVHETKTDLVISTGFCGGISTELQAGDIVVAMSLSMVSENKLINIPVEIPSVSLNFAARQAAEGYRVFGGLFVSTPSIMQKNWIRTLLPADAFFPVVEMESAAIAIVALENNIPFCGIRAVSDPFDEELGFSLDEFCDDHMRIRIPKVLLTIVRKPRIIPQLIRLAHNSSTAGKSLSQTIKQFLVSV